MPCRDSGNSNGLGRGLIYYCLLNYTHSLLLLQGLDSNESAFGVKYVGSEARTPAIRAQLLGPFLCPSVPRGPCM